MAKTSIMRLSMLTMLIFSVAGGHVALGSKLCHAESGKGIVIVDNNEGKRALPEKFNIWQVITFSIEVAFSFFSQEPNEYKRTAVFGYPMHGPVNLSLVVNTNQDSSQLLGKWIVGHMRPIYSGQHNNMMSAKNPVLLRKNCYDFRLIIHQMAYNISYVNQVTFRVIANARALNSPSGNETLEAWYSFRIPYIMSRDDLHIISVLCIIFLGVLTFMIVSKIIAVIYGHWLFESDFSNSLISLALKIVCWMINAVVLVPILLVLYYLMQWMFGKDSVFVEVIFYILLVLSIVSVLIQNTALYIQLCFVHMFHFWYRIISYILVMYVIVAFLVIVVPMGYHYFSIAPCVTMATTESIYEVTKNETARIEDLLLTMRRISNNQPLEESEDKLPKLDDRFSDLIRKLGGNVAKSYEPDEIKDLFKKYSSDKEGQCLDFIQNLTASCEDAKFTMAGACDSAIDNKFENNFFLKMIRGLLPDFNEVCHVMGSALDCEALQEKYLNYDICKTKEDSTWVSILKKAKETIKLATTNFKSPNFHIDPNKIKRYLLSLPDIASSIVNGIIIESSVYFPLLLFTLAFYISGHSLRKSALYVCLYKKSVTYDNFFIGRSFKMYDRKKEAEGREPVLPLLEIEKVKLKIRKQFTLKKHSDVSLIVVVLVLWCFVYFFSDAIIKYNTSIANMDNTVATISRKYKMAIRGTTEKAEYLRMIANALNIDEQLDVKVDFVKCLPNPSSVPHSLFVGIFLFLLLGFLEDCLQLLLVWRQFITGIFYPKFAYVRLQFLYHTLEDDQKEFYKRWIESIQEVKHKDGPVPQGFFASLRSFLFDSRKCIVCEALLWRNRNKCPEDPGFSMIYCNNCWHRLGSECPVCFSNTCPVCASRSSR